MYKDTYREAPNSPASGTGKTEKRPNSKLQWFKSVFFGFLWRGGTISDFKRAAYRLIPPYCGEAFLKGPKLTTKTPSNQEHENCQPTAMYPARRGRSPQYRRRY